MKNKQKFKRDEHKIKIVGIDLDGVLANFEDEFFDRLVTRGFPRYTSKDIQSYDWQNWMPGMTKELFSEIYSEMCLEADFFYNQAWLNPDDINAVKALSKHSILYAITSRGDTDVPLFPYTSTGQSLRWLQREGITPAGVIVTYDKTSVCHALGVEYMLEDSSMNFRELTSAGIETYLLNRPYNQDVITTRRVDSVDEFVHDVLKVKE